jgi:rhodanese-related sulfurtransferase
MTATGEVDTAFVHNALLAREEIALLDVREEATFATGHPLFAASLSLSRLELEIYDRVPRRSVEVVCYDNGEGLARRAATRLVGLGYEHASVLGGGLGAWKAAGLELFSDVNAPSKAFGELVDATLHPPSIEPTELFDRLSRDEDVVVLDVRRFEEYQTMSIPSAQSVPGGELVRRFPAAVPSEATLVVVNCAGRTRSIIGTQSLLNAGVANKVVALRNGTIGWTLAGLELNRGASSRPPSPTLADGRSRRAARALADKAGVVHIDLGALGELAKRPDSTSYLFDVRDPDEYAAGHRPGFRSAPGGQLVQETDYFAPVRGATLILGDDEGVRADMTASWLAQMGWTVFVLDAPATPDDAVQGPWQPRVPPVPAVPTIESVELAHLEDDDLVVFDLAPSRSYRAAHIPGSSFVLRAELVAQAITLPPTARLVLTSEDGLLAAFAAGELQASTNRRVEVVAGGTEAWWAARLPLEHDTHRWRSPPLDSYRRPYEGTEVDAEAMQAYLDWEYGLVGQLDRDGTHGFFVLDISQ